MLRGVPGHHDPGQEPGPRNTAAAPTDPYNAETRNQSRSTSPSPSTSTAPSPSGAASTGRRFTNVANRAAAGPRTATSAFACVATTSTPDGARVTTHSQDAVSVAWTWIVWPDPASSARRDP